MQSVVARIRLSLLQEEFLERGFFKGTSMRLLEGKSDFASNPDAAQIRQNDIEERTWWLDLFATVCPSTEKSFWAHVGDRRNSLLTKDLFEDIRQLQFVSNA